MWKTKITKIERIELNRFSVYVDFTKDNEVIYSKQYFMDIDVEIDSLKPEIAFDLETLQAVETKRETLQAEANKDINLSKVKKSDIDAFKPNKEVGLE